ncbi:MAG: hypothetical protein HYR63_15885 [Proteobacteria bacterium]|nr:hypothetical protein [Pseudomonadota bacterium]MBI3499694.1 hypothetical protein [Pseudomonadota bacterium]
MSRLERHLFRIEAQLACLNDAVSRIAGRAGPVLELGLGKGRTYDHLLERLPERDVWTFDRALTCDPSIVPDLRLVVLGEFRETLPTALSRLGRQPVLVHSDCGSDDPDRDVAIARFLEPVLEQILAPGGILVSDRLLRLADTEPLALPQGIAAGRYFMAQRRER